jgi:dCMP deaminase
MNERFKEFYMRIASNCANMSRAIRLKVGCVIVKDNNIISFSWNGTPRGWDNNCENIVGYESNNVPVYKTKPEVIHAESNAISKLARSSESGLGADLFVTHSPCLDCAKLIYQSGIKRVYFGAAYRSNEGIVFLERSGVEVHQV